MVRTLFARGACVDEEWVAESPGLRRNGLWWGCGEGMPSKSRGGSLDWLPGVWSGKHSPGTQKQESCTSEIFGGINKMLLSFTLLQAQASGRKQANKQKTMAFSPVLAKRGLNLELTLPIWPQLRPATIQNIHRQQNRPRHWLQSSKVSGIYKQFSEISYCEPAGPPSRHAESEFFFFNLIRNCWGCVLVLKKAPSWFQCTVRF